MLESIMRRDLPSFSLGGRRLERGHDSEHLLPPVPNERAVAFQEARQHRWNEFLHRLRRAIGLTVELGINAERLA